MLMWLLDSEYQMVRDMLGNVFRMLYLIDFSVFYDVKLIQLHILFLFCVDILLKANMHFHPDFNFVILQNIQ